MEYVRSAMGQSAETLEGECAKAEAILKSFLDRERAGGRTDTGHLDTVCVFFLLSPPPLPSWVRV